MRSQQRVSQYRDRNARYLSDLQDDLQQARADERWHGWAWMPDAAALAGFVGRYGRDGALLPEAGVETADGALFLTSGDRRYRLTPAAPDLFGAETFAYDQIIPVGFLRSPGGTIVALDWDGDRYELIHAPAEAR